MHIPKETTKATASQQRIALIGAPGSGKTTACLTFPNPFFIDFDHKLPSGVNCVPFWDPKFVDSICSRTVAGAPPNRRDAIKKWLRENAHKFTAEQTLIIDSWTMMQNSQEQQADLENSLAEKSNKYYRWDDKQKFSKTICELLEGCSCIVVVTFHETIERNDEGEPTGKLRAVMDGGFRDQLLGHFTDVWRQLARPPVKGPDNRIVVKDGIKQFHDGYFWQLIGDDKVDTNLNPTLGEKVRAKGVKMVRADYKEIQALYNS